MSLRRRRFAAVGSLWNGLTLAVEHSGQNAGLGRRTVPILRQTASWMGDHFVVKPSAIGQPTWPTQRGQWTATSLRRGTTAGANQLPLPRL